jgi:hypothetical protein
LLWPNGNVYYELDANISAAEQTIVNNAMAQWEAVANVNFILRSTQANYIHIQDSTVANSEVGMIGGRQILNFGFSSFPFFSLVHELGHSLSYYHEQSRTDRDTYVTIVTNNIESGKLHNFDKEASSSHYGPYDFDSVMHYSSCGFSICDPCTTSCRTIVVNPPYDTEWASVIGQRNHLSQMDAMTMSFLYPQGNWRFADGNYTGATEAGTFLQPAKTFSTGKNLTPTGGTLWIQPGSYTGAGTHSKQMTLRAPLGGVELR